MGLNLEIIIHLLKILTKKPVYLQGQFKELEASLNPLFRVSIILMVVIEVL